MCCFTFVYVVITGEMAVLRKEKVRTATIVARDPVCLLEFTNQAFKTAVGRVKNLVMQPEACRAALSKGPIERNEDDIAQLLQSVLHFEGGG